MSIYQTQSSPLGELLLVGEETEAGVALTSVSLPGQRNAPDIAAGWRRAPARSPWSPDSSKSISPASGPVST